MDELRRGVWRSADFCSAVGREAKGSSKMESTLINPSISAQRQAEAAVEAVDAILRYSVGQCVVFLFAEWFGKVCRVLFADMEQLARQVPVQN